MSIRGSVLGCVLLTVMCAPGRLHAQADDLPPAPESPAADDDEPRVDQGAGTQPAPAPMQPTAAPGQIAPPEPKPEPEPEPASPLVPPMPKACPPATDPLDLFPAAPAPVPPGESPAPAPAQPPAAAQPTAAAGPAPIAQSEFVSPSGELLWRMEALMGVGVTFDHTLAGVNPLGFGFGLRGDYRLFDRYLVGMRTLYFVGGSSELPTGLISMQSWLVAAEGAYPLRLNPLSIEPGAALGFMVREIDGRAQITSATGQGYVPGSQNSSKVALYVSPGVRVLVPLGIIRRPELEQVHVGIDARLEVAFGSAVSGYLQLLIVAGARF